MALNEIPDTSPTFGSDEYFQNLKNQRAGVGGPPGSPPAGSPATALAGGGLGGSAGYYGTGGTAALRRKLLMRRAAAQAAGSDGPMTGTWGSMLPGGGGAASPWSSVLGGGVRDFGGRTAQPNVILPSGPGMPGLPTTMPPFLGGPGNGPNGPIPQSPTNPTGPVPQNPQYPGGLEGALQRLSQGQGNKDEYLNILQYLFSGQTAPGTMFSPGGSAASMESTRENARQTADALARRNALVARASGATPSGLGYANLMSSLQGQGDVAASVNSTLDRNSQLYDDLLRQLYAQSVGYNYNQGNIESQGIWNRRQAGAGQGTDWPGILGPVAAAGIGAL